MVEGLKYQTSDKEPGKLNRDRQKDEPQIPLSKGVGDAFQFTKAQIDKRGTQEKHNHDDKFPHKGGLYTNTRESFADVL
jgi:hypothetical protein